MVSTDAAAGDSSLARQVYDAKDPNTSFPHDNIRFRSRDWFDDPHRIDQGALYLERYMNYGITPEELRSGKPIIGIAQTGSDLVPCNRHHLELARRVRDGIRDAGGIPMEFPVHPLFENCLRPTAALERNLAYLGLVEDRKSTRLNSSHANISYAVFCLKKKTLIINP